MDKLKKSELLAQLEAAHAFLDDLIVARGDAHGAYTLKQRLEEFLAHAVEIQRQRHIRMHGEE